LIFSPKDFPIAALEFIPAQFLIFSPQDFSIAALEFIPAQFVGRWSNAY
jgi:hypothetical protein